MKNRILILISFVLLTGLSTLKAQEWSPAQKEVWKNVNDYWAQLSKGDINGFMGYVHADYVGWDNDNIMPNTKESSLKWLNYWFQGVKVPVYEIDPLTIKIYGDVAFVHYYYSMVRELPDGKKKTENGRWTDILLKQGNKWVLIGDHGGSSKQDD